MLSVVKGEIGVRGFDVLESANSTFSYVLDSVKSNTFIIPVSRSFWNPVYIYHFSITDNNEVIRNKTKLGWILRNHTQFHFLCKRVNIY